MPRRKFSLLLLFMFNFYFFSLLLLVSRFVWDGTTKTTRHQMVPGKDDDGAEEESRTERTYAK